MPCLLHVGDDRKDRERVKDVLLCAAAGLIVVEADNGQKALAYLSSGLGMLNPPSLILLDLCTPVPDGRQMLTLLKSDPRTASIPVVVFSMASSESDRQFCAHIGVELMAKPLTYPQTQAVMKQILHNLHPW